MMSQLHRQLEAHGYQGRVVSIQRLCDLQEEIAGHHEQGRFDRDFYRERLDVFTFRPPDHLPDARSLIVVAVPEPQLRVTFTWGGSPRPVIVPPTFLSQKAPFRWRTFYPERQIDGQVATLLAAVLGPAGYRVVPAMLPKKMLAVHAGLGAYGRNNLCYVPGMGSFHRLVALCSDFSCSEDNWQEPKVMDSCEKCVASLICAKGSAAAVSATAPPARSPLGGSSSGPNGALPSTTSGRAMWRFPRGSTAPGTAAWSAACAVS